MTELPPFTRTITLVDMVAYAGSTWDWHRLHYDPAYLAEKGLTTPVVDGQMLGAILASWLRTEFGPGWDLTRLSFRFKSLVQAGETITCTGRITERTGTRIETRLRIDAGDRVAVAPAAATLERSP